MPGGEVKMENKMLALRRKRSLGIVTCAILVAGSACIISIPTNPDRDGSVNANPIPTKPDPARSLERHIAVQATQVAALAAEVRGLQEQVQAQATFIHYLATRGPALPPRNDRAITPTPYHPLTGTIEIDGGLCCVGGIAGDTTTIEVAFSAQSPFAEISAMRVHAGGSPLAPVEFDQIAWQPYLPGVSFEVPLTINWVGFYVQVQFRDALGNLSPIYVDDISVEGMPSLTPTTP